MSFATMSTTGWSTFYWVSLLCHTVDISCDFSMEPPVFHSCCIYNSICTCAFHLCSFLGHTILYAHLLHGEVDFHLCFAILYKNEVILVSTKGLKRTNQMSKD